MEQFIVSARKYRPNSFESLIGQDSIAVTLKNSIVRGQLAHAYLFCGPRGVGKTSTARIFAKSINCLNPSPEMEPCGKCESCLSFAEGRSYCIHELDAASNNSVDDIRNLTEIVRIPPQIGKYSVYIIDEVHMLSSSAFNAFLKTLEEPPSYAIFILATTEKHKILPTVLSRCQTYDFNRISITDIVKNLIDISNKEGVKADTDTLHIIAMKADGSMRDALTLFDQIVAFCGNNIKYDDVIKNLNVLDYEYYFKIIDFSLNKDYISSIKTFDEILSKGFNALHFISGISSHLRDLLVCKNGAAEQLLSLPPTLIGKYREQSNRCSIAFIYNALSITTTCETGYRQSGNQRLLIEFALLKLSFILSPPQNETIKAIEEKPSVAPPSPSHIGFSIKEMMSKAIEKEAVKPSISDQGSNKESFTKELFMEAWKELAESEKSAGRSAMGSTMLKYQPEIDTEKLSVVFFVSNTAQKAWVEDKCLMRMTSFIREKLKNASIDLNVETIPNEKNEAISDRLYMPSQKADYLLKNNEELRNLQKDLDLDIK